MAFILGLAAIPAVMYAGNEINNTFKAIANYDYKGNVKKQCNKVEIEVLKVECESLQNRLNELSDLRCEKINNGEISEYRKITKEQLLIRNQLKELRQKIHILREQNLKI